MLLAVDAMIDSSMFDSGRRSRETYENFSAFMARFHVSGISRIGVEIACETLTMALGGGILALALASSAFHMTSEKDWL
jgi:penicillin-binding protein 1A